MSELGGTINERIGDLRTSMNLTQTELSEKTGIPISVISRIESGKLQLLVMMCWQSWHYFLMFLRIICWD